MGLKDFLRSFANKNSKPTTHVDSSPLSDSEQKDFDSLYENDPGWRNDSVLDYDHPDYISEGTNRVKWGNDNSDTPHSETMREGKVISRTGSDQGNYFADGNTDFNSRQLPYSEDKSAPRYYEVQKPFSAEQSTIAEQPWNDAERNENAQQYKTEQSEAWLRDNGYIKEITADEARERSAEKAFSSLTDDLHNDNLFKENAPGDYTYGESQYGKSASGSLTLEKGERDASVQRTVGGEDRRPDDDGGHLIGTRFNGAPDERNIDAQNSNLNRSSYKKAENEWADSLNNGDSVYVNVDTYKSNDSERPDAYMGYSVTEHPDGSRDWDAFSYQNESAATQEDWNNTAEQYDIPEAPVSSYNGIDDSEDMIAGNELDDGEDMSNGDKLDDSEDMSDGNELDDGEDMSNGDELDDGEDMSAGNELDDSEDMSDGDELDDSEDMSDGDELDDGEDISDGEQIDNSEAPEEGESQPDGEAPEEGESQPDGEAPEKGENQPGGEEPEKGENQTDGEAPEEGESQTDGEAPEEGESQTDGEAPEEGESQTEGEAPKGGENKTDGEAPDEGENQPEEESTEEGESQTNGEAPEEGESQTDNEAPEEGEGQTDGEAPEEGENQPDGEAPEEGENQPDGEVPEEGENQGEGESSDGGEDSSPSEGNSQSGGGDNSGGGSDSGESNDGGYDYYNGYGY